MPRFSPDLVVDADNAVVGRVASSVAKELLKGRKVLIVNADAAIISGNPEWIKDQFLIKIHRGDQYHGPFYPKQPDRILRRVVWGMLPRKPRGKAALMRLRVICGSTGQTAVKLRAAENTLETKYITLAAISKHIGGSVRPYAPAQTSTDAGTAMPASKRQP